MWLDRYSLPLLKFPTVVPGSGQDQNAMITCRQHERQQLAPGGRGGGPRRHAGFSPI